MKLNKFLWDNYRETEKGKKAIELFENKNTIALLDFIQKSEFTAKAANLIDDLSNFLTKPDLPKEIDLESGEKLFEDIITKGFAFQNDKKEGEEFAPDTMYFLYLMPIISTWLFYKYPGFFKPYFFRKKFRLLTQIADNFEIELPEVPLKRYKEQRLKYYWSLSKTFLEFQKENEMSPAEFCAFLYDFAPKYIEQNQPAKRELPEPTQVWLVGGDKYGNDFMFLDNHKKEDTEFWQGNVDTKRGDIIIMYCLAPRSYIHSIWRATTDGIADPFFFFYGSIFIGEGIKTTPITLKQLKEDEYFSKHPLVRKNLQGVSGYSFNSNDYARLLELIVQNGGTVNDLPQLYSPIFSSNQMLKVERDVEVELIEPFLKELGYTEEDWERQLPVRMGRGERNFPDYAFLTNKEKNYEEASMLVEAKFWIKNNKELEETFKQVYSYGQRLSSKTLLIADKDAIWIYERHNQSFDRSKYIKKYWKELEKPDEFASIKKLLGRK